MKADIKEKEGRMVLEYAECPECGEEMEPTGTMAVNGKEEQVRLHRCTNDECGYNEYFDNVYPHLEFKEGRR